ncbi:MAG: T9SS type A sorting domain-containing protein [Paludibacter sp.]
MKKNFLFGALMFLATSMSAQNTIDNAFFDKVNFRGAMGTTDWTSGWSSFDPQNKVYPATERTINAGDISTNTTWGSPLSGTASFTNPLLSDPFFTQVDYVGAFGKTDWTAGWGNFTPNATAYPATTVTVNASDITTNTTWTKNNVYLLNGWVYVTSGATLTIEAGTVIRGDKTNKGALIIEPGGKLIANGTAAEPIVFTSNQPAGNRASGDWGGVVLCGKAKINQGTATIEGGLRTVYGGTDDTDNSGSLKYVRIEYGGVAFMPNNEINGLTFGGVGSGTSVDYVQVSYAGDDSFEWFGGNVNCKHLIAFAGLDDDFDTDFGFSGKVQFIVGLRDPQIADISGSNFFESDNDAAGSSLTPYTSATFCNVSSFGPLNGTVTTSTMNQNYKRALHIRRNSRLKIFNGVFSGWPVGLYIDGNTTQANATNGDLVIENCVFGGMAANYAVPTGQTWDVTAASNWFNDASRKNSVYADNASLLVSDPYTLTAPKFTPVYNYFLNGWAYVTTGATLTIKPGVTIRGDKTNKGALIIEPGAKLIANGTAADPIVFTSNQPVGSRASGDWGGVVLCGKAKINQGTATIEGGLRTVYGGTDDADNSGSLKYVRLEYGGVAFMPNNEINGLTFGGVGSGTSVDYVQVSYAGDDSFEWFGGTVNCKHLIAFAGLDDDFDTDFGYSGMVQYAVALRDPQIADISGSNSFESDNDAAGSGLTPFTSGLFSNVSSFGPLNGTVTTSTMNQNYKRAMHIRRNSKLQIYNSIFAGWPIGLYIDGNTTQANATAGDLKVRNSVIASMATNFSGITGQTWATSAMPRAWYKDITFKNDTLNTIADLKITDPFNLTAPNFLPTASSKMLSKSYWQFTPTEGLQYYAPMVFTAYAKGSQVTTPGSMIMVYKDGECLGSQEITPVSNDFQITVGSNESTNSNLDIKLYDASSRTLYNLPTVVDFDAQGTVGTPGSPVRLDATGSLSIALVTGGNKYNWISFNVIPENNSVGTVLNYTATNGDFISDGIESSFYFDGVWYGMESTGLLKNKMYVLYTKATAPGSVSITNQPLVKNEPISFIAGYNWFGYSLTNSYDIRVALNGISAVVNDNVVTQGKTAWYSAGGWGALAMVPGKGYIFKSANPSTFSFPTNNASTAVKVKSLNANNTDKTVWTPEVGQRFAMPVLAQVYKNGSLYQHEGMQMGIFKNGQCFGAGTLSDNTFNVTVGSDLESLSGLSCKVFDPKTSQTYEVEEAVDFESLVSVGNISTPAAFHIKSVSSTELNQISSTEQFSVYPNQIQSSIVFTLNSTTIADASVTMYDMQGKFVKSLFSGNVDGVKTITVQRENLNNGLYLIKASVGDKQFTQKVVLK